VERLDIFPAQSLALIKYVPVLSGTDLFNVLAETSAIFSLTDHLAPTVSGKNLIIYLSTSQSFTDSQPSSIRSDKIFALNPFT